MFFKNFHHNSRLKTVDYAITTERGKKECLQSRRHKAILSPSTLLIQRFRAVPCLNVCQSNSRLWIL